MFQRSSKLWKFFREARGKPGNARRELTAAGSFLPQFSRVQPGITALFASNPSEVVP